MNFKRIFQPVFFIITLSGCKDNLPQQMPTYIHDTVYKERARETLAFEQKSMKVPKYKIIRGKTSYSDYDILIASIDLNAIKYKEDINLVLDDIATMRGNVNFTAYIYDDKKAAELNYSDLGQGNKMSNDQNTFINNHLVDVFGKDIDGTVRNSYFVGIPEEDRSPHVAWSRAFDEAEFNNGYTPHIK